MNISRQFTSGQRLLHERKSRSWSQQMLAEKIGTSILNINRWEHDKTQPQPYYREKLCEVFSKSHDELFGEPEEEEPTPLWNIPYLRNLYFTGREDILTRLHDALTTTTKKAVAITQPHAISGLGGIGKTQTAVEYAYRYSDEYKAILWTRADSHEVLVSELVFLATVLDLPEKHEADQRKVVAAVVRWFQHAKDWLLIFDNADDLEMVSEFLPTRGAGHTLLTTRSQATGKNIKGIEIEKMGREEGALLLLRRAKLIHEDATLEQATEAQRRDAETICEVMDGLPLALDQAAAYIEENECILSDYLDLYQTHRATLLKRRGTFSKRDYPKPVATTWSLSFEQVQRDNPAAADLLRLCAFLHPDAIPEEMIVAGASELGPPLQAVAEDPIQLAEAIGALRKYSLVRRNPQMKTLTIHRLVQMVLRDGMDSKMQREWAERTVRVVNKVFPEVEFALWPTCEQYISHMQVCAELTEQWNMIFSEAAQVLSRTGNYLDKRAQYTEAESLLQKALRIREQLLGSDHIDVATDMNDLAGVYVERGKYLEAEVLYQRAQDIRERVLGPIHPDVAATINGLGELYREQGKFAQAESFFEKALAIRMQTLGSEHSDVAMSLNNLAMVYDDQGKYAESEPFYRQALAIWERMLGPDHPHVATCLNNLGWLYYRRGCYDLVEAPHLRALTIREKGQGPNHPDVAMSLNALGLLYRDLGKYAQAEPFLQRALLIREQALGPDHADVGQSLQNVGVLYYRQGKYDLAEPLLKRSISIREQLGPDNLLVAYSLNSLAMLYRDQGKYDEAEKLFQRALSIREPILGRDSVDVAYTLTTLAVLYRNQGKYDEAELLFRRALTGYERALEPGHPSVAQCLNDLALLYYNQGKYTEAEKHFQRALAIREKTLGSEHPDLATTLQNYAELLRKTNREAEAAELEKRAQNIRRGRD